MKQFLDASSNAGVEKKLHHARGHLHVSELYSGVTPQLHWLTQAPPPGSTPHVLHSYCT